MSPIYAMNTRLLERPEHTLGDEFPERPGQPECSFFLKTGDCKYKSACKFNHPKSARSQSSACLLSDLGLPLRPVSYLYFLSFWIIWLLLPVLYNFFVHYCFSLKKKF